MAHERGGTASQPALYAYDPDTLPIAVLGRPHGVQGEVILRMFDPDSDTLDERELPFAVLVQEPGAARPRELIVDSFRRAGAHCLVAFTGIDDRDAVGRLANAVIRVPRDSLPPLEPGEFYVEDLHGCAAVDPAGGMVGVVTEVFFNGAHHVVAIVRPGGTADDPTYVPVVPGQVTAVDAVGRRITVVLGQE